MNTPRLTTLSACTLTAAALATTTSAQDQTTEKKPGFLERYDDAKIDAANNAQTHVDNIAQLWSGLDDLGITLSGLLIIDSAQNWQGGLSTNGSSLGHLLEIGIELDLQTIADIENATLAVAFQNQHGSFATEDAGDFQETSNILADGRTQIAELYYQQTFADGFIRLLVGKRDANVEFAYVDHGAAFQNSSFGLSPTLFVLPTYPDPATGAVLFLYPGDLDNDDTLAYAGAGVFDGALQEDVPTGSRGPKTLFDDPADLFLIGEFGLSWGNADTQKLPGRFAVGVWAHTGTFEEFDGGDQDGTEGFYLLLDQLIHREDPDDPDNEQGFGFFFQYGWADPDVSEVEHHVGAGIQVVGLLQGRDEDIAGIGITYVQLSDDAGFDEDQEVTIEGFYLQRLAPFLSIQNDLQYIMDPGGSDRKDALVSTTRAIIEF